MLGYDIGPPGLKGRQGHRIPGGRAPSMAFDEAPRRRARDAALRGRARDDAGESTAAIRLWSYLRAVLDDDQMGEVENLLQDALEEANKEPLPDVAVTGRDVAPTQRRARGYAADRSSDIATRIPAVANMRVLG